MKKLAFLLVFTPVVAHAQFALHNGDRVVFYGDSITDQRQYTVYTEAFIRTRFPNLDVSFVHSGWGGDRVTGGGGGDIDTRLNRDVFAYHPTVVTIMLGMNDAGYQPFNQSLFDTYSKGYWHMVDRLRAEDRGVRLTLIEPSPFDDVTRAPSFDGGYNGTLLRYSQFVTDLGKSVGATVCDMNTPVVEMLNKANATNNATAQKIIPDRVHPGEGGHLIMAEALLKTWNAPAVVSAVEIENGKVVRADNTKISGMRGMAWTQLDNSLPYALNMEDATVKLAIDSSDFVQSLDQQTLKVAGLSGSHRLMIDDKEIGVFSASDLAAGLNLAMLNTPMRAQASRVLDLVRNRTEAHNIRWRDIQTHWGLGPEKAAMKEKDEVYAALDRYDAALDKETRKAAMPVAHKFELVAVP